MTAALLTVHGMGETDKDYAKPLLAALRRTLGAASFAKVHVHAVDYQSLLQPNQGAVWKVMDRHVHYDDLRRFLLFGFSDAAGLENRKELPGSVYEQAQRRIAEHMLAVRRDLGAGAGLVCIAQSLGGQVISSFLWDAQRALKAMGDPAVSYPLAGVFRQQAIQEAGWGHDELKWLAGERLFSLHTTGCNIPIFVAAHQAMHIQAIAAPNQQFRWLNHYDPDDVLGWPLKPLKGGYETLVEDHRINSGRGFVDWVFKSWNPLSHTTYWTDGDVVGPLADDLRKLLA